MKTPTGLLGCRVWRGWSGCACIGIHGVGPVHDRFFSWSAMVSTEAISSLDHPPDRNAGPVATMTPPHRRDGREHIG